MGIRIVQLFGATGPANQAASQPAIQLASQSASQPTQPASQPVNQPSQPTNPAIQPANRPSQPRAVTGIVWKQSEKHWNSKCISLKHSQNMGKFNLPYENITKTLKIKIFVWKHNKHIENVNFQLLFIDLIFHSKFKLSNYLQQLGVSGKLWGPLATGCGEDCTIWLGNWDIHRKIWVIW